MSERADYCCPDRLRDEISQNMNKLLLLDCRGQGEYTHSHIRGAISVSLPSLMMKRLNKGSLSMDSVIPNNEAKARFSKHCKTASIILYDECSTDLNASPPSVLNLLVKNLRQDGSRACFLLGGFSTFAERFPELCQSLDQDSSIMGLCNLMISEEAKPSVEEHLGMAASPMNCPFPVQVLPFLYLGCAQNSADLVQLKNYGISCILNVTSNVPNMFEEQTDFKYLQIPISDHWSQNLASFFPQAIQFIDEARTDERGVLVHCLAGISRSVTVTVAYLMSQQNMTLNQAYDHVKNCKPNISPNFTFMGQLMDFEKNLTGGRELDSGEASDSEKLSLDSNPSST